MNLSGRDLQLNLQGDDVALLQSELRQLGFAIGSGELSQERFGPQTNKAVADFQRSHNIPVTGVVNHCGQPPVVRTERRAGSLRSQIGWGL